MTGLAEAVAHPTRVKVAEDLTVPVASIEAQAVLKILAWSDRREGTQKDALDVGQILSASSRGLFADHAWEDDGAISACDGDIIMMGPFRLGRDSCGLLSPAAADRVRAVLDAESSDLDLRLMVREGPEMLRAFRQGFH